jgi:hypothetical protein
MEIIDLLPPIERLGEVYRTFVANLEKKLADDEKRLDETFEVHRTKLHSVHQKTLKSYEVIFNKMLQKLNEQEDIPLVTFFEKAMRSKNIHMYSKAVENLQLNLDNIEENGGTLVFSSRIVDANDRSYRRDIEYSLLKGRGNYFQFYDDFWGMDDNVIFKVKKEYESPYDRKERVKKEREISIISQEPSTMKQDIEELMAAASAQPF